MSSHSLGRARRSLTQRNSMRAKLKLEQTVQDYERRRGGIKSAGQPAAFIQCCIVVTERANCGVG